MRGPINIIFICFNWRKPSNKIVTKNSGDCRYLLMAVLSAIINNINCVNSGIALKYIHGRILLFNEFCAY
jgi:hypothetical protein